MKITEFEMKEILRTLSGAFQNFQVNQFTIKSWVLALGEFTLKRMQKGLIYCLKEHTTGFAPTPGEFRYYCIEAARTPQFKLQQQTERDRLKKLEKQNLQSIPMPDKLRKLLGQLSAKMTIKDALANNSARQNVRRQAEIDFFRQ